MRNKDPINKGTIVSTRRMATRAGKAKRKMALPTKGKESDLETIAEEVETNSDCLVKKGT